MRMVHVAMTVILSLQVKNSIPMVNSEMIAKSGHGRTN